MSFKEFTKFGELSGNDAFNVLKSFPLEKYCGSFKTGEQAVKTYLDKFEWFVENHTDTVKTISIETFNEYLDGFIYVFNGKVNSSVISKVVSIYNKLGLNGQDVISKLLQKDAEFNKLDEMQKGHLLISLSSLI